MLKSTKTEAKAYLKILKTIAKKGRLPVLHTISKKGDRLEATNFDFWASLKVSESIAEDGCYDLCIADFLQITTCVDLSEKKVFPIEDFQNIVELLVKCLSCLWTKYYKLSPSWGQIALV